MKIATTILKMMSNIILNISEGLFAKVRFKAFLLTQDLIFVQI